MERSLGLGYVAGSLLLFAGLLLVLFIWHKKENGIEVYPVTDRRVEGFHWTAILFSNSLGTAFGGYLSDVLGLSYPAGAAVTACIILAVLHNANEIYRIMLIWIALIFTRPFGVTFGDLLTKPTDHGGLNFSRGIAALITAGLLVEVLVYSDRKDKTLADCSF